MVQIGVEVHARTAAEGFGIGARRTVRLGAGVRDGVERVGKYPGVDARVVLLRLGCRGAGCREKWENDENCLEP
jgi:hypothetical protein